MVKRLVTKSSHCELAVAICIVLLRVLSQLFINTFQVVGIIDKNRVTFLLVSYDLTFGQLITK